MALSIGNDRNYSRMYRVGQNTTPNSVAFDNKNKQPFPKKKSGDKYYQNSKNRRIFVYDKL